MKNLLLILGLGITAHAGAQSKVWQNPECLTGDCEVRSMALTISKSVDVTIATKGVIAEMKTSKPEQLANYAFVQYLRGCVYESNEAGPTRHLTRRYLGSDGHIFKHVGWQVDSMTPDPIYWSTRNPGFDEIRGFEIPRTANYMVVSPIKGDEQRWGGKISNVVDNRLFVKDEPTSGAFSVQNGKAKAVNSALEFRMCLYHIKDLPKKVANAAVEYPNPIACLEWDVNFSYNFKTRRFVEGKGLHPYCL